MSKRWMLAAGLTCVIAVSAQAQERPQPDRQSTSIEKADLVRVSRGVETDVLGDRDEARRELAAKVEMAARMACADSWRPRSTIYESIRYTVDWSVPENARAGGRKAIARDISVRCRR